jgi:NAD-dependent deacetylase
LSDDVERLVELLRTSERIVALTGAGVSTDSGIPDFRSASSGLWAEHDPMEVASLDGFQRDPRRFYEFWGARFGALSDKRPSVTHEVLAALERAGRLEAVITQNIDGLHQRAGSAEVLEVHGSYRRARCLGCAAVEPLDDVTARVRAGRLPICQRCGEMMKPDVVLFGEALPPVFERAQALVTECDLLLVLGSSLAVHPVAGLVPAALRAGARVAIVNRDPCEYDDLVTVCVQGELRQVMPRLRP